MVRLSGSERQLQVVEATLTLLADTPLATLSTRQIAAQVGISQPALFRHFDSREAILVATVQHTRRQLQQPIGAVLATAGTAEQTIVALSEALLGQLQRTPGFCRLLFAGTQPGCGALQAALAGLADQQRGLVAELVRAGQTSGELRSTLDPQDVATAFVGIIQGLVLRALVAGEPPPAPLRARALVGLLFEGLRDTLPSPQRESKSARPWSAPRLSALDVRPQLAQGEEPFADIQARLAALSPGDVLLLEATFRPRPLLSLLARQGHGVHGLQLDKAHHVVLVRLGGPLDLLEVSDLPAPEPLEATLRAAAALQPGASLVARTPRVARFLAERLPDLGVDGALVELADGSGLALIWRAP